MAEPRSNHSSNGEVMPDDRLAALYREQFRFVWRSLRRLGVAESDLPDAVHDVFLVVHKKLDDYLPRGKVTSWLYAICLRTASDRRRSAARKRELYALPIDELTTGDSTALVERRQALSLVDELLDQLPLEQRVVFTFFELDGMSGEEIAELLQIPIGTVWSRLRLARRCFREAVERLRARDEFRTKPWGARP